MATGLTVRHLQKPDSPSQDKGASVFTMGNWRSRCPRCRRKVATLETTPSGQKACQRCVDDVMGLAAGLLAGGDVVDSIATSGWYRWLTRDRETRAR